MQKSTLLGRLLLVLTCLPVWLSAQTTGDLAFVAFNADGNDGFAIATFVDIPANTQIWFTDDEWSGTAFGTGEGDLVWSNPALTPAGTVIYVSDVSTNAPQTSAGVITPGSNGSSGFSSNDEGLYVYLGTERNPTTFLTAITNGTWGGNPGSLAGTGLTIGSTAIEFGNAIDVAEYTGPRLGQANITDYLPLVYDLVTNWITQDGSGNQDMDGIQPDVPFNTTPFVTGSSDITPPFPQSATVQNQNTVLVVFSEPVSSATAGNTANYSFAPALAINGATLTGPASVELDVAALTSGVGYTLTITGIADTAGNVMPAPVDFVLLYNNSQPDLAISEIMYNPPSDDSLEFIEIYNNGTMPALLGGMQFAAGVSFVFPELTLAPGATVLLAVDTAAASSFFGVPFPYQFTGALSNGGEALLLVNSVGDTIDLVEYDDAAPWPLGPPSPDGDGPSIELIDPTTDNNVGSNWRASGTFAGLVDTTSVFASPGVVTLPTLAVISVPVFRQSVAENAGTATFEVSLSSGGSNAASVQVVVSTFATATLGSDFTASDTLLLTFLPDSATQTQTVSVTIADDNDAENDEYVAFRLMNPTQATISGTGAHLLYIRDNDRQAPVASEAITLEYVSSYSNATTGDNSAEIVAYDSATQRIFIANSEANRIDIVSFADPANLSAVSSIDISAYGGINSIATNGGIVAAAIENDDPALPGLVVFFDTDGTFLKQVTAGVLPDMVCFTPDGTKVLTANEGQPLDDYSTDPEGSVTIIDISGGIAGLTQANVTTADFSAFNSQEAALLAAGVRKYGPNPSSTLAQDLEPEYITVSDDSQTAWVTLQENNALARVDLATGVIDAILPLGYKDHSIAGAGLDGTNQGGDIHIANYPIRGIYMPDAIANFTVGGTTYLITANEGDGRDYNAYSDESSIGSGSYVLDPTTFPDGDLLKAAIGPLKTSIGSGDTDGDGDFDEIHVFGSRSFTLWNAATGDVVYDSGDDLELITAQHPVFGSIFNASNSNITRKNRSDDKGPEPEGVVTAMIDGKVYAFVALERIGGVMVYDVTNPIEPAFVDYANNRNTTAATGDLGPEGLIYIPGTASPDGKSYLIVANEISSTLTIFELGGVPTVAIDTRPELALRVYPNPAQDRVSIDLRGEVVRHLEARVIGMDGREVAREQWSNPGVVKLNVADLPAGIYLLDLRSERGQTQRRLIVH
ncbi:MAG: hypothetical protein OHK0039_45870 [Bacteroidia bacterium]